jgi:hypothetical protein
MTTKIYKVTIQVDKPSGDSPGRVSEGCYTLEDSIVTLTDRLGAAVRDDEGKTYSKKLEAFEDAYVTAKTLTREFRRALRGKGKHNDGFSAPIHYPKLGIV